MARGAHGRSGPAPDPNALRRERDGESWVSLPAAGRQGETPEWPLENHTDREATLWEREWRRPQAIMWERNGQAEEVAMYVRSFALAEQLNATVASRTLLRQQQEALGLSIPGLARNKWKIEAEVTAPVAKPAPKRRSRAKASASSRERFKVVDGGRG